MGEVVFASVTSPQQAADVADFFHRVWADGPEVIPMDLILAMLHVDAFCEFASQDGQVVAASTGFRGMYRGEHILHSHVTASLAPGLGYQLKLRQREWAKERSIPFITWTFDPLIRRNGFFNMVKLAAIGVEYSPNFYGVMVDSINAGDDSDRITAMWDVRSFRSPIHMDEYRHAALTQKDGVPEVHGLQPGMENIVHLPADASVLRKNADPLMKAWRESVREILDPALNSGWTITGMLNREAYILTPPKDDK